MVRSNKSRNEKGRFTRRGGAARNDRSMSEEEIAGAEERARGG